MTTWEGVHFLSSEECLSDNGYCKTCVLPGDNIRESLSMPFRRGASSPRATTENMLRSVQPMWLGKGIECNDCRGSWVGFFHSKVTQESSVLKDYLPNVGTCCSIFQIFPWLLGQRNIVGVKEPNRLEEHRENFHKWRQHTKLNKVQIPPPPFEEFKVWNRSF